MKRINNRKKLPMFRCYTDEKTKSTLDVVGNSLFDLIGKKEPEQTKSLGYVLARSEIAMKCFLELVYSKIPSSEKGNDVKYLMKEDYIVDCELMLQSDSGSRDRADIVIRFPESQYAIIVEAKSIKTNASSTAAYFQGMSYSQRLSIKKKSIISLTNNQEIGNCVQWNEIVSMLDEIIRNNRNKDISLENDFLNYILKIKGLMKYYDIEVLSISAQRSMEGVKNAGIYECPSERSPYKSRGEHKPLFIAFRGWGGSVKKLYKVEQLLKMPIAGDLYESLKDTIDKEIIKRIEDYKKLISYGGDNQSKWVFVLDLKHSIDLPHEIRYKRNNSFVETQRPLSDYFTAPTAKGVVLF